VVRTQEIHGLKFRKEIIKENIKVELDNRSIESEARLLRQATSTSF